MFIALLTGIYRALKFLDIPMKKSVLGLLHVSCQMEQLILHSQKRSVGSFSSV